MLNYYQPRLRPFLKFKANKLLDNLREIYYYSFEDGLWDILQKKFHNKKVKFLVPDFYCSDVLDNIRKHGHDYIYYPLDKNFQITTTKFARYIWLYQPEVIIIFHACGITANIIKETTWLNEIGQDTLIIEDCVHRLINPQTIKLIYPSHILVDSLRKVSPIPGSRMIGEKNYLNFETPKMKINKYLVSSTLFYWLFRLCLRIGFVFNSDKLITLAHQKFLQKHDDIIGDEYISQSGIWVFDLLKNFFDYEKVTAIKIQQVEMYEKYLGKIFANNFFYKINISKSDYQNLHVYPLGVNNDAENKLVNKLNKLGIPVWYKFTDSPWSETRRVLFLPLGFHVSEREIKKIAEVLWNTSQ